MFTTKRAKIVSILFLTCALIAGFFISNPVLAQTDKTYGLNETAGEVDAFKEQVTTYNNTFLTTKVGTVVGLVLSFVGVIFLLLMIYAGINWMTAAGNADKVSKAKDLMINAVIGLIIVLAAYAITTFIGNRLI